MNKKYNPIEYSNDEIKNKCGIYQIRNIINNKIYIGSSNDLYRRKVNNHFHDLRLNIHCNQHLQNSYNFYGEENFVFEIIEFCSEQEQFNIEQYWLDIFFGKNICYNENPNANKPSVLKGELNHNYGKPSWNKGLKMKEETKEKLRKPKSFESRKKMSEARIGKYCGEKHCRYNKKHSEETKQKMKQNHADFKREKHPKAIKVVRLMDGKVYNCMRDCIDDNNISETTLTNHCKNRLKCQKFIYYSDFINLYNLNEVRYEN